MLFEATAEPLLTCGLPTRRATDTFFVFKNGSRRVAEPRRKRTRDLVALVRGSDAEPLTDVRATDVG